MTAILAALALTIGAHTTTGPDWTRTQIGPDNGPTIVLWTTHDGPRLLVLPDGLTENE